jgi:hypothetical protein
MEGEDQGILVDALPLRLLVLAVVLRAERREQAAEHIVGLAHHADDAQRHLCALCEEGRCG